MTFFRQTDQGSQMVEVAIDHVLCHRWLSLRSKEPPNHRKDKFRFSSSRLSNREASRAGNLEEQESN